jgi:hypothetical protein
MIRIKSEAPPSIAILIPCYNEEMTIAKVVKSFKKELPEATIYVFDNNSTDATAKVAKESGAVVYFEGRKGKGNVIGTMFRVIDADVYVMVDGDDTYPANKVHALIDPILTGRADMVVGSRLHPEASSAFHPLNRFGNKLFLGLVGMIFRGPVTDLLSGYRAFNRRIVKSLPLESTGFEIETELTCKCLQRGYVISEYPVDLSRRPPGSSSKINIMKDGILILNTILALLRDYRPLSVFGSISIMLFLSAMAAGTVVLADYLKSGHVEHYLSAIITVAALTASLGTALTGIVLHAIARRFQSVDRQLQNMVEVQDKWRSSDNIRERHNSDIAPLSEDHIASLVSSEGRDQSWPAR